MEKNIFVKDKIFFGEQKKTNKFIRRYAYFEWWLVQKSLRNKKTGLQIKYDLNLEETVTLTLAGLREHRVTFFKKSKKIKK